MREKWNLLSPRPFQERKMEGERPNPPPGGFETLTPLTKGM
jgi:hypothetical protein